MHARVVAIHQPNFFPWLGFFDKLRQCDVFIVLDDVQFQKTGGCWTNRVRIRVGGQPQWLTLPVQRNYRGYRRIREMEIDEHGPWREKMIGTLRHSYARAPHFRAVFPGIEALLFSTPAGINLAEFNLTCIRTLAEMLGLDTGRLVLASSLPATGTATDLLVSLTRTVGGTAYLCGGGSGGYLEEGKFADAGLQLLYQKFQHPRYDQVGEGEFVAGLSVLDALFSCGTVTVRRLLGASEPA